MSDPYIPRHIEQRLQLSHTQPLFSYWDNLSKIWLTKGALIELNRRNDQPNEHSLLYRPIRQPLTRRLLAEQSKGRRSAAEILNSFSVDDLEEVKRFSRLGGPDMSDLRGYPEPFIPLEPPAIPPPNCIPAPNHTDASGTVNTKTTGPYSRNFEQLLIDYGVFPAFYEYPDGREPPKPNNLDEIKERMKQRRSSLLPSRFTENDFENFQKAAANAKKEEQATQSAISVIEGNSRATKHICGRIKFGNLQNLTGDCTLTPGNPDLYDGARPEQLDRRIRDRLKDMIIPSTQDDLPVAPNFFLHAKGRDGTEAVASRQCVYDGVLGERGQLSLRSYGQKEVQFDNNAHTVTSVYLHPTLSMYSVYAAWTNGRQEYYTHLIGSWAMSGDIETFRKGVAAFRNLRDWAKEQRDEAITLANGVVDQVEGRKSLGEEDAEIRVASDSTLHSLSNGVGLNNGQTPSPAKRPSLASKRGRPSKRTKTKR